jgi:2,3-bisphosphoglycerate-independent phosphoglycerate mutase
MESTKHIVLLGDGMADEPIKELGDKTPLQYAETPNMDKIAKGGTSGMVKTIPDGFEPGSDVANMSILGYDPSKYYTGRAPIEAANMGIELESSDIAFRMNLVTLGNNDVGRQKMVDYSAGYITTEESTKIVQFIEREFGNYEFSFYPGKSYRHIMVWKNGKDEIVTTPPHDILGSEIGMYLPHGDGVGRILKIIKDSQKVLLKHPVNEVRISKGVNPANSLWLWGQGKKPTFPAFGELFLKGGKLNGAVISAVDLLQGLGVLMGLSVIEVEGATGWLDTNYAGKVDAALKALSIGADFVYLHVEAPDEAGHMGDTSLKVQAIEEFDKFIVGPILDGIDRFERYRILLLPDHHTPVRIRTHTSKPVPFSLFGINILGTKVEGFSEASCEKTGILINNGHTLMKNLFG